MSVYELERSQRQEAALVAMPMAAVGVLLGSLSYTGTLLLFGGSDTPLLFVLTAVAVMTVLVPATTLAPYVSGDCQVARGPDGATQAGAVERSGKIVNLDFHWAPRPAQRKSAPRSGVTFSPSAGRPAANRRR